VYWLWIRRPKFNVVRVGGAIAGLELPAAARLRNSPEFIHLAPTGGLMAWGLVQ